MIQGVTIKPIKKIADDRGAIFHMLKITDPEFTKFGEIYFSVIYPGVVKAWHIHTQMTLNYAVISGMIKLVLYDNRDKSPTKGELMEICIGDDNYSLVIIPPGVWNGFMGLGTQKTIVANCSDMPHDPEEIKRMDPLDTTVIPYDWNVKWR
jgi:dTDP-4-dehydrorhamnose 3,5-epimerase